MPWLQRHCKNFKFFVSCSWTNEALNWFSLSCCHTPEAGFQPLAGIVCVDARLNGGSDPDVFHGRSHFNHPRCFRKLVRPQVVAT
jgi:hypothetical protein